MQHITAPPDIPIGVNASAPMIRPLPFPIELGRLWTAGLDRAGGSTTEEFGMVWLRVTPGGHAWKADDPMHGALGIVCRGCELPVFDGMDSVRCRRPATSDDIASALLAGFPRPAPSVPRPLYGVVCAE